MCMSLWRKKLFFNFLDTDFLMPKIGHQREKQPLLGPVYVYMHKYIYKTINLDLKIQGQQFPYTHSTLHHLKSSFNKWYTD